MSDIIGESLTPLGEHGAELTASLSESRRINAELEQAKESFTSAVTEALKLAEEHPDLSPTQRAGFLAGIVVASNEVWKRKEDSEQGLGETLADNLKESVLQHSENMVAGLERVAEVVRKPKEPIFHFTRIADYSFTDELSRSTRDKLLFEGYRTRWRVFSTSGDGLKVKFDGKTPVFNHGLLPRIDLGVQESHQGESLDRVGVEVVATAITDPEKEEFDVSAYLTPPEPTHEEQDREKEMSVAIDRLPDLDQLFVGKQAVTALLNKLLVNNYKNSYEYEEACGIAKGVYLSVRGLDIDLHSPEIEVMVKLSRNQAISDSAEGMLQELDIDPGVTTSVEDYIGDEERLWGVTSQSILEEVIRLHDARSAATRHKLTELGHEDSPSG